MVFLHMEKTSQSEDEGRICNQLLCTLNGRLLDESDCAKRERVKERKTTIKIEEEKDIKVVTLLLIDWSFFRPKRKRTKVLFRATCYYYYYYTATDRSFSNKV